MQKSRRDDAGIKQEVGTPMINTQTIADVVVAAPHEAIDYASRSCEPLRILSRLALIVEGCPHDEIEE
jgi:hypothetical protein